MGTLKKSLWGIFFLCFLGGCGEVDFFFFVNTGGFTDVQQDGLVVIIGTPRDEDEVESVRLLRGAIPLGMELMTDTTLQGIPEETGIFSVTLEVVEREGFREEIQYDFELEE